MDLLPCESSSSKLSNSRQMLGWVRFRWISISLKEDTVKTFVKASLIKDAKLETVRNSKVDALMKLCFYQFYVLAHLNKLAVLVS